MILGGATSGAATLLASDAAGTPVLRLPASSGTLMVDQGAWTSYTPTITPASGSWTLGLVTGAYCVVGKTIHISIGITIANNGNAAGNVQATLPFAPASSSVLPGKEVAVNAKSCMGIVGNGSTTLTIHNYDGSYPGATGAVLILGGTYQMG
ncbi:hypothetical protein CRBSH125_21870 [Afipia carboxidovorans]|nr:hypothetical protein CRBSH125_21870 [Afipia carboxidovorans]